MEKTLREHWKVSNTFQKFEILVCLILCMFLAIVVVFTLARLAYSTIILVENPFSGANAQATQVIFGVIVTTLIALELIRAIIHNIKNHAVVIHASEMILIGIIALVRKLIILDYTKVSALTLIGLAASIAALSGIYWVLQTIKQKKTGSAEEEELQ